MYVIKIILFIITFTTMYFSILLFHQCTILCMHVTELMFVNGTTSVPKSVLHLVSGLRTSISALDFYKLPYYVVVVPKTKGLANELNSVFIPKSRELRLIRIRSHTQQGRRSYPKLLTI